MVLTGYKKTLSIYIGSSSDGELTNYQIKLTLVRGSGTNSGNIIYLNNESLNWPNDFRFSTDKNGNNLIDFWREEYDATDGTWWVKVPTIPASGGTTIYLHVGNINAIDDSDIAAMAKSGAGHQFDGKLDTSFWSTVTGSPLVGFGPEYPIATSGTTVSANSGKYEAWPTIVRDSNGKLYIFYRVADTNTHTFESSGRIVMRTSIDEGESWSSESTIANTTDLDDKDVGALIFDDDGTETILIVWCAQDGSGFNIAYSMKAPISTLSWGSPVALDGTNKRATHGNPVLLSNGRIIVPLFAYNDSGNYKIYIAYSTNNGDSWTSVLVGTDNTNHPNEGAIIELKTAGSYSGKICIIVRTERSPYRFRKSESLDYGSTWGSFNTISDIPSSYPTSPEMIRLSSGDIAFFYTATGYTKMYISQDETTSWEYVGSILSRSSSERKHYVKVLQIENQLYAAWCTNLDASSDVYFNSVNLVTVFISNATEYLESSINLSQPTILEARIKFLNYEDTYKYPSPFGFGRYLTDYSTNCARLEIYTTDQHCLLCTNGSNRSILSGTTKDNDWSKWRIVWTSSAVQLFDDDIQVGTDLTSYIPSASMPMNIGRTHYITAGNMAHIDYIFAREYTENEPEISTVSWLEPRIVSMFWM